VAPTPAQDLARISREPRLTGYLSARETLRDDSLTFTVNRARLTVMARPLSYFAVRVQGDLAAIGRTSGDTVPAFDLTDAFAQLALPDSASAVARTLQPALLIGQFRTPFSLEFLTPFALLLTANRSQASDLLASRRDIGVYAQVNLTQFAVLGAALVNGEGPNRTSNPDGHELAVGRLTLRPTRSLAIAGKWGGQAGDHRWGYDARLVAGRTVVEGEYIRHTRPESATTTFDGRGGYALASYKVLSWLQPVLKWERLRQSDTGDTTLTWTTYGVNLLSRDQHLKLQANWIVKSERPVDRNNEFVTQLVASF
jgi:hypothetical protein